MKKIFFVFLIILPFLIVSCKSGDSADGVNESNKESAEDDLEDNDNTLDFVFYSAEMNCDYSAYSTAHLVTEFHCEDLGDSYYEATSYKAHYFAASNSNGSTHNNNGMYKNMTEFQLIEIIKLGNTVPDFIEKRISTKTISRTVTDSVTGKTVVIYIPEKTKHDCCYYGITRK